jgi:4-hydroxy-tetrahydrodipicolinate reductase
LMMQFAQEAAKFLPAVEIIEMHHPQKLDAPSGTAMKTAHMIAAVRQKNPDRPTSLDSKARGEWHDGVPIHSVRLPGFYSHQSVIFGGLGEILTISHQGVDRQCTIPGILLACRNVMLLTELVYGLESFVTIQQI